MSCDEIKDLLAAYAIGALEGDERRAVTQHLNECRRHDVALAGLSSVVNALPLAVEERDPPPELRERLLQGMREENPAAPPSIEVARARRRPAFRPAWALGAAAAIIAGLLGWNVALQTGDDGNGQPFVREQTVEQGSARLVFLPDEDLAVLDLDFADLLPGQVYQAWEMHGDVPESLGIVPNDGTTAFATDLTDADNFAVSIEPAGGSDQPTTEPVLVMALE